jgi:glycosyltransferase involved in cell wall biosynthesis
VLPEYRGPFLETLAKICQAGLSVFAGKPQAGENIAPLGGLTAAGYAEACNRHLFFPDSTLYFCWQTGLLDWLETWQPDALIVEANSRYLSTPGAVRWMHARSRPVLGWGLGAPPLGGGLAAWRESSRRRFLHSLDGLIAYSRRGAAEYAALGIPRERIVVAANAVTPPPAWPLPERPPVFRSRPVVLFVGRLQARKRVDLLLRACAALPDEIQPHLIVVGDGPERAGWEDLARSTYPATEFPGALHGAELEGYFRAADLFVLPGTGGLAVQQAMAYGLPVMVAQGDGTQDDLVRPANGWQLPPGVLAALQSALADALSDAGRLRNMGAESYRIVRDEINIEQMAVAFARALQFAPL